MEKVGFTDTVFMNDSRFANAESFHDEDKLRETLRNWVELSSSMFSCLDCLKTVS